MERSVQKPLVSVIITSKNREMFIREAIESVLAQTYRNFELIVIDGHSTDATPLIVHSYPQVRFVLQTGTGIADAYNQGVAEAKGELLAYLSSDDRWTPNKLEVQVSCLVEHPEIQYAVAKVKFFLQPGCSIPPGFRPELLEGEHIGRIMETLLVRKALFARVGTFRTDVPPGEDVDWYARCKDLGVPMVVVPEVLLLKRVHDNNASADARVNNPVLLTVLRDSIKRQREAAVAGAVPSAKSKNAKS